MIWICLVILSSHVNLSGMSVDIFMYIFFLVSVSGWLK